ncbi:hypothetical protein C4J81_05250 [Deltaproteobacteria bacterium Smac51]|nr:hypothetical protein C4J81_05250 [Deltaproteobacteria bacterium Smac51]
MRPVTIIKLLILIFTVSLAAGCATVSLPEKDLKERLEYNESVQNRYRLDPQWWKIYNDPRLDRLVDQALRNNIDLAKAAISVNRALYQARLIGADLVPSFSGSLDGSASRNISEHVNSNVSVGGDLRISYELDLWQKVADSVSASKWEYQATLEDREAARLALIGSVVDSYYNLAYLNDAIIATEDSIKNYRSIAEKIRVKYDVGKVASVEVAQAQQSLLSAENNLSDLLTQRKNVEQTLRDLLNLKPTEPLDLGGITLIGFELPGVDLNVPLSVLANRPDLKAAEFRIQKAFKNVSEAEKAWLPSITLSSALGSSGANLGSAFDNPVASGAVSISLPFLDWNRVRWNLRISEADFETTRLDFEQALTTALNEVDTWYYTYRQARTSLTNTEKKYVYDLKISSYYRDRYTSGAGELSDWLGALNTANSSRLSMLNSRYQTVNYENMIYKAMAGRYVDRADIGEYI